jgi:protein O-GlcNAc transferase
MDYYLTDRHILPPGQFDHQFTEKLAYLPVSAPFQPELDAAPINALPALTNGYVTFGSFNRISKIGRNVVAAWGKLLRALPDSKLLLGGVPPGDITDQMLGWLAEEGVEASRVRVHPRCQLKEYLALHHQVDINLDAFPYSGGTTTLHALWMGVPTLTLAGDTAAGRQTACILEHMQLPEYIAHDVDDFVRKGPGRMRRPGHGGQPAHRHAPALRHAVVGLHGPGGRRRRTGHAHDVAALVRRPAGRDVRGGGSPAGRAAPHRRRQRRSRRST